MRRDFFQQLCGKFERKLKDETKSELEPIFKRPPRGRNGTLPPHPGIRLPPPEGKTARPAAAGQSYWRWKTVRGRDSPRARRAHKAGWRTDLPSGVSRLCLDTQTAWSVGISRLIYRWNRAGKENSAGCKNGENNSQWEENHAEYSPIEIAAFHPHYMGHLTASLAQIQMFWNYVFVGRVVCSLVLFQQTSQNSTIFIILSVNTNNCWYIIYSNPIH